MTTSKKICLWCGDNTDGISSNAERKGEHVFPECIGGKVYLPVGSVCKVCNNRLGILDQELRYGHPAMMSAYQRDPKITGKRVSGASEKKLKKKAQRIQEQDEIIRGTDGSIILRDVEKNKSAFYKPNFNSSSELFLRGLYKCLANVICYELGSFKTRQRYPELITFVKDGGSNGEWTYALSIANYFNNIFMSSPEPIFQLDKENSNHLIIGIMHTSGLWIVGTEPLSINKKNIENLTDQMLTLTQQHMDMNPRISHKGIKRKVEEHFGGSPFNSKTGIGVLHFHIGVHHD